MRPKLAPRCLCAGFLLCGVLLYLPDALAQGEPEESSASVLDDAEASASALTPQEAALLLAQPLPEASDARYQALQRQFRAAQLLEDRSRQIDLAQQLVLVGRGKVEGERWIVAYLNTEFNWGSSGKALDASESFVVDGSLTLGTRASAALRQTYFAAQGHDRAVLVRYWARAESLSADALKQGGPMPPQLPIERLQVRAEVERNRGDLTASVASLREAVGLSRRQVQQIRSRSADARSSELVSAGGWLDGSLGMLSYALVRQGRPQEAVSVAQDNMALWRAGQLSDGQGARWNYRLANSLNATQQFEAGLAAARESDAMLQRAGASVASHTRWLARQEVVRGLIGLRRWAEADASYREFLANMPPDVLARTRASDWRLLALLAVKNGRLDEALTVVERIVRFRNRLYGANHPQTQEATGVRAVVRLLRGEVSLAMRDYETLFAATLDNPAGWIDLDMRGVRGFVFGVAFDEFMRYVAAQALTGKPLDAAVTDRALQIADRSSRGVTQRALTDSTARVMAATPALRALLEQEQAQRQAAALLYSKLNKTLGQEDSLRQEVQADGFKELPEEAQKALTRRLREVREQIKTQQAEASASRGTLGLLRDAMAQQFPGYADLVTPVTPKSDPLRRLLGPGEALLVVYPTDSGTLVWLMGADGHNGFSASALTAAAIDKRVAELRSLLDLGSAEPGRPPALPLAQLHALYRGLLAPLEGSLRGVRSLIVATNGALASLPFAALVTQPPDGTSAPAWLVRQMAVSQLPSSSALLALRRVPPAPAAAKALMGFGDPVFKLGTAGASAGAVSQPNLLGTPLAVGATRYDAEWGFRYGDVPPLPETRAELLSLAQVLGADPRADLRLGAQATRRAVVDANLLDRRVLAFATHGLMPGELPGISKPALALSVTADAGESPLLELDDVLGLRLNAQWVLLAACNTAAGEAGGGAMSGLVRGFFFAGARSVMATHWGVESESAAALSTATFAAQAKAPVTRSQSLQQAQLAMIDGGLGAGRWTHPFYWAPYALFGDPAR
jgi:CHAT domain-containing protein